MKKNVLMKFFFIISLFLGFFITNVNASSVITLSPDSNSNFTTVTNTTGVFKPNVSIGNDGTYVIGWVQDSKVFVKAFDKDDVAITGDILVDGNTGLGVASSKVMIKMHPVKGDFLVLYHKLTTDGNGNTNTNVYYKVYGKPTGTTISSLSGTTPKLLNNQSIIGNNYVIKVTLNEISGDWYVAYTATASSTNVYMYIIAIDGVSYNTKNDGFVRDNTSTHYLDVNKKDVGSLLDAEKMYTFYYDEKTNQIGTNGLLVNPTNILYFYTFDGNNNRYNFTQQQIYYSNVSDNYIHPSSQDYSNSFSINGILTGGNATADGVEYISYNRNSNKRSGSFRSYLPGGNDDFLPGLSFRKHLFNGGGLYIFSDTYNQSISSTLGSTYRVIYWDGENATAPKILTQDLTLQTFITDLDVNIYGKIVVVKGE